MTTTTTEIVLPTDCTHCFAVPGEDTIIDMIHPKTGLTCIYGKTLEQVREQHPNAEAINYDDFAKAKATRQDTPIEWHETTEEKYWDMLEVLPPAAMGNGGFLVGEPWDHHALTGAPRYAGYREQHGKFWEANRPLTRKEFAAEMLKPIA